MSLFITYLGDKLLMKEILPVDMVVFPIIFYRVLYIPSGFLAGFLPSTLSSYLAFRKSILLGQIQTSVSVLWGGCPTQEVQRSRRTSRWDLFWFPSVSRCSASLVWLPGNLFFLGKKRRSETNEGSLKKTWPTRIFGNGSVDSVLRLVDTLKRSGFAMNPFNITKKHGEIPLRGDV